MRVLRIAALSALLQILISCSPGGALTPREAFIQLRLAYVNSDPKMMMGCLSSKSLKSLSDAAQLMQGMREDRRQALADYYGVASLRKKQITPEDCLLVHFSMERKSPAVSRAVRHRIIDIERNGTAATVRVENGMDLRFVREGPYWKFDLASY